MLTRRSKRLSDRISDSQSAVSEKVHELLPDEDSLERIREIAGERVEQVQEKVGQAQDKAVKMGRRARSKAKARLRKSQPKPKGLKRVVGRVRTRPLPYAVAVAAVIGPVVARKSRKR